MRQLSGIKFMATVLGMSVVITACGSASFRGASQSATEDPTVLMATAGVTSIGIVVVQTDGNFVITDVMPGSGAALSNIHPGSVLLSVAGYSTHRMSLEEVRRHLLGPARTFVNIIVRLPQSRGGLRVEIAVPRI